MVMLTFLSQRGAEKLAADGYIYVKDRNNWRCERKAKSSYPKCPGRGKRFENEFLTTTQHNHPPDLAEMSRILYKVFKSHFLVHQIIRLNLQIWKSGQVLQTIYQPKEQNELNPKT